MGFHDVFAAIKQNLSQLAQRKTPSSPENIDDPLAKQVEWSPLKGGGTNFRTHKLVEVSIHQVRFKMTWGAAMFALIFLGVGLGVLIGGLYSLRWLVLGQDGEWEPGGFLVPFGLVFAAVGGFLFRSFSKPACFDRSCGLFWKGKQDVSALLPAELDARDDIVKLDRIYALQILREYCSGNKSSYYSYELNLVLDDGSRVNVTDHGNLQKLREDAQLLANFLDKPIWDIA